MKKSNFSFLNQFQLKVLLFAVLLGGALRYLPHLFYGNKRIYKKELPIHVIDDFLSEDNIVGLLDWIKKERRFATAVEASSQGVVSIGEDEPVLPNGGCEEQIFVSNGEFCHVGGRMDIFAHYAKTGGFYGAKETIEKLFSSIYSFINYYPDKVNDPIIKKLFESDSYKKSIKNMCGAGLDLDEDNQGDIKFHPLQVNIVMIPPGMVLLLHQDNQWYWGINQRSAPDWLLHVMKESGLYDSIMIPQAQGVAYLHGTPEEPVYSNGGRYLYYPNGPGGEVKSIPPKRGQAIIMDGGQTIHGVERTHPGHITGNLRRGAFNRIEYQGNETWYVLSDNDLVDVYKTKDFRITFVWRGLCFKDGEEQDKFKQQLETKDYKNNDEILKELIQDLKNKKKMKSEINLDSISRKDLIMKLLKDYMQYPLDVPNAWIPINYCALGYNKPWIKWLLSPLCQDNRKLEPLNEYYPPAKQFCDPSNRPNRQTSCLKTSPVL